MKVSRLAKNRAILMICDIQEKFFPHTYKHEGALEAAVLALKSANLFELPVIATEHNPKAFGKLHASLAASLPQKHHLV